MFDETKSNKKLEILRRIQLTRILTGEMKVAFFGGRPRRHRPIGKEDIINLKIMLHTCKDMEEFLYNS